MPSSFDNSFATLERAISELDHRVDSIEWWVKVATWAVAIGVTAEIIVVFKEHRDEKQAWRRGTIKSPEKPSKTVFLLSLAATAVIAIGVAVEAWLGMRSADITAEIRNKSRLLVGMIRDRAAKAEERAALVEADNLDLQRLLRFRRHLEDAVTPPALNVLDVSSVRVFIMSVRDSEPSGLASEISAAILKINWRDRSTGHTLDSSHLGSGVQVWTGPRTNHSWAAGEAITRWLQSQRIHFVEHRVNSGSEGDFWNGPLRHVGITGTDIVAVLVGNLNFEGELGLLKQERISKLPLEPRTVRSP
jgi:hypothetical protein